MRVLVVHAHPLESSFNGSLCRMACDRLVQAGHRVDRLDLYAEGFDPVLSPDERLHYDDTAVNRAPVEDHVRQLLAADALILIFPVWNYGFPAILKGWLDRVFIPGVSFELVDGKVRPALHNIRRLMAVTSYGGTRFRTFLAGDPPRRIVNRFLRGTIRPRAKVDYLAHYDMNRSTIASRHAFMDKVSKRLEAL